MACYPEPHGGNIWTLFQRSSSVEYIGSGKLVESMKMEQKLTLCAKIKVMIADELTRYMSILIYPRACIRPLLSCMIIFLMLFFGLLVSCSLIMSCCHFLASFHLHHLSLSTNISRHKKFHFHLS